MKTMIFKCKHRFSLSTKPPIIMHTVRVRIDRSAVGLSHFSPFCLWSIQEVGLFDKPSGQSISKEGYYSSDLDELDRYELFIDDV